MYSRGRKLASFCLPGPGQKRTRNREPEFHRLQKHEGEKPLEGPCGNYRCHQSLWQSKSDFGSRNGIREEAGRRKWIVLKSGVLHQLRPWKASLPRADSYGVVSVIAMLRQLRQFEPQSNTVGSSGFRLCSNARSICQGNMRGSDSGGIASRAKKSTASVSTLVVAVPPTRSQRKNSM